MAELRLGNANRVAVVDEEVLPICESKKWYLSAGGRIVSTDEDAYLSRVIMGNPKGVVDHINGDVFDNRKSNLRVCSQRQNSCNQKKHKGSLSCFKGVHWHKALKKWRARITPAGKSIHLGLYESEIAAAKAYDNAAREYYGEFARLNFGG